MSLTLRSLFENRHFADAAGGSVSALQTLIDEVGKNIIAAQTALNASAAAAAAVPTNDDKSVQGK